ncbi:MAG: metallophosphoesterase family protein [Candidatus Gastranaerophilales bacterium]
MKVAIISDIHGNFQALEAVLADIELKKCEKIFCLGDIAMAGPQPRFLVDFIQQKTDWEIIQGNTDKLIADYNEEIYEMVKNKFPLMANALKEDVEIFISNSQKDFLRNLPPQKELEVEGVKVLLVHGSPRSNCEDILPEMPIKQVEEIIKETTADLILCGHTHVPCGYQTSNKQTVVNVGSVGRPMTGKPKACYAIADFEDGGFSIEHRFVDYDVNLAVTLMETREFEGAKEIASLLKNPTKRHV